MGGEVLKNRFKLIGDGEKILPLKMLNKNKVFNELFSKVEKILKKYHIILFRGDFKIPFEYLNFDIDSMVAYLLNREIQILTRVEGQKFGKILDGKPEEIIKKAEGIRSFSEQEIIVRFWCVFYLNSEIISNFHEAIVYSQSLEKINIGDRSFIFDKDFSKKFCAQDLSVFECREEKSGEIYFLVRKKGFRYAVRKKILEKDSAVEDAIRKAHMKWMSMI